MSANKILVGQSGGPTVAINASLAGVVAAARKACLPILGMRFGIQGFLEGRVVDLNDTLENADALALLCSTPSSWLGSCRFKLPPTSSGDAIFDQIFERLETEGVGQVIYIGGNDSMDTIAKLGVYGKTIGSPIRFVGVPKTIDNDLVNTDHTPGYGSAARFVACSIRELIRDADVYDIKNVIFVEIMGRDAGWLAAASVLADPDLILLPEVPFDEEALVSRLARILEHKPTVVVAVSEGIRTRGGGLICDRSATADIDEFGHRAALSGTSRYLASLTKRRLGCKTRAVELSTLQRCASHLASKSDLEEAQMLGRAAVEAALLGKTGKMCALKRLGNDPYEVQCMLVDVLSVANQVRNFPSNWITVDRMGVSARFVDYLRPLVGDLPPMFPPLV